MRVLRPVRHVDSYKRSREEVLHTLKGMIGCCMKDNMKEHFEYVHHNVSADDMSEGKMAYANFGKVGPNNHVSLSHSNILQKVHQWASFFMKKFLGVTLYGTFYHMCKISQSYPDPTCVIPLRSTGMDVRRAASLWKSMMNSNDISNVFRHCLEGIKHKVFQISRNCA
jgi:hypothetical protein